MFCHTGLGANEAIEHFPVGRRLAFDAAKGRLWVVCKNCERWNLSPLDERWEAVEDCEKLFRDSRLRVSTDNIGLAKLKEGTTLIRIGDPHRPEMAAWRYGDQFHRRRRKHLAIAAGGVAVLAGMVIVGPVLGIVGGVSASSLIQVPNLVRGLSRNRTLVKLPVDGSVLKLTASMVDKATLRRSAKGEYKLSFGYQRSVTSYLTDLHATNHLEFQGADALRVARHLLPRVNRAGGTKEDVATAVRRLETSSGADHLFTVSASSLPVPERQGRPSRWISSNPDDDSGRLSALPPSIRLALEMSLHEADERRALEGELAQLEDRWREAEEVAAISDDMFVPSKVGAMLRRLKGGSE